MNDNWYKDGGWYKPLNAPQARPAQAATPAPKKKKKRWLYLAILLLLLGACCVFLVLRQSLQAPDPLDGFDVIDEMPRDFRDYLDSFYEGVNNGTVVKVNLPEVEDRGSLELKVAGSGSGSVLSMQELYDRCTPSIVYIKAEKDGGSSFSWGTGVIVSSDGYIVTNTHVIAECDSAEVGLTDGSTFEAKLVGADGVSDIALLKIEATGLTPATFAESVAVGENVAAIGNPIGESYRLTMTRGIISGKDRAVSHNGTSMNLLQTDAAINEGNSGGPLFNERGQVTGIVNMKLVSITGIEGIGFAIPSDTVRSVVAALIRDGAVLGRSTIGITVGIIPENAMEYYDLPEGLYISYVQKGSDAYKQGLKAGDILTEVNGQPVSETQDVTDAKSATKIGETMHFTVWRNGKTLEFDVMLMDANDIYNAK